MALQQGKAGESTKRLENTRYKARVAVTLIGVISVAALIYLMPNFMGLTGIIVIGIAMKLIMTLTDKETRHYEKWEKKASRGAKAEEKIADILNQLPDDYMVFHDIVSAYGNIDHVVIKNNSVFLIETKSHRGEVTYNTNGLLINNKPAEKDFISQILRNTYWLKGRIKEMTGLDLFIKPLIVFTNAFVKAYKPVKNVSIINKKYLLLNLTKAGTYSKAASGREDDLFSALRKLQSEGNKNG